MNFREFVEHMKADVEQAIAELVLVPDTHFFAIDGAMGAALVKLQNVALLYPGVRRVTWKQRILPLMDEKQAKQFALVVIGLDESPEHYEQQDLKAILTAVDRERIEVWDALISHHGRSYEVDLWEGPKLESQIPGFHVLQEALR